MKDRVERFQNAVRNCENDTVIQLLRELRRDLRQYVEFPYILSDVWRALHWYGREASPEILDEARQFFTEYRQFNSSFNASYWAIHSMAVIEDDEHITDFLVNHCSNMDFTADKMLVQRYRKREEKEKADAAEEVCPRVRCA